METIKIPGNTSKTKKEGVNHVLTRSYFVFFAILLIAVVLDIIYPIRIISSSLIIPIGITFLVLGSFFIVWAQKTSRILMGIKTPPTKKDFARGPYAFLRGPTHVGVTLLLLGFGLLMNSIIIIILSFVANLISRKIFLRKEEELLANNYGDEYEKYKREVRSWF